MDAYKVDESGGVSAARRTADDAPYAAALRLMSKSGRFSATDRETLAQIAAHLESSSAPSSGGVAIDAKALQYAKSFIKAEDNNENQFKDIRLSAMARELVRLSSAAPAARLTEGADEQLVEMLEHYAGTDDWKWIDKDQQRRCASLLRRLFAQSASRFAIDASFAARCRPAVAHYMRTQERASFSEALSPAAKEAAEAEAAKFGKLLDEIDAVLSASGPHEPPKVPGHRPVA